MSLDTAFSIAQKGIISLEQQIGIISNNVNNANQTGYTRKTYQADSIVADGYTIPSGGQAVQAVVDTALSNQVNTEATTYQYSQTMSNYLADYSDSYGGTSDSDTTISTMLDNLTTAMQGLQNDPTQTSDKANIVSDAQAMASELNQLSTNIQGQRQQASDAIGTTVTSINDQLQTIYDLNRQIVNASGTADGAADLVDARNTAINTLSQYAGFQFNTTSDNQVTVSLGGVNLVEGSQLSKLSYTGVGSVSASTSYPGGFSGINVNGADLTTSISTGTLGALITLRDTTLPGEQSKLNSFASTLSSTMNGVLANGSAYPSQTTVTGTTAVTAGTALSATGTWRVAVTDSTGTVQSYDDLNLSSYSTVGALVTALNGISGVSASVASGKLSITSTNSSDGISLNQMTSSIGGVGATQYFGFNNLFTASSSTITATNISINPILSSDSSALASSTLTSGAITAGTTRGLTSGDATITTALVSAMNANQSFAAGGDFSSQSTTLSQYASALISDAATQASSAKNNADTAQTTYTYLTGQLSSETGVNIDEESANLAQLQNYYSSDAQVLSVIRQLYTTLITAYQSS